MLWIVLTTVFAVLKLIGVIAWPWLWVFAPLIIWAVLTAIIFLIAGLALTAVYAWETSE
jgi:hypothetical protein